MENENVEKVQKKRKKGKTAKIISFDEEVVPKDVAQQILAKESLYSGGKIGSDAEIQTITDTQTKKWKKLKKEDGNTQQNGTAHLEDEVINIREKTRIKRKNKRGKLEANKAKEDCNISNENDDLTLNNSDNNSEVNLVKKIKKKKKKVQEINNEDNGEHKLRKKRKVKEPSEPDCLNGVDGSINESSEVKKTESIRERKRKKYALLLKEKKLLTDMTLQQKSLNYLSKWKNSTNEWKFEKLRQIWLQQNMYDSSKVPQNFWETLVEYFSHSKGKARSVILKEAVKLIEDENSEEDETKIKVERARDIIQNLQE